MSSFIVVVRQPLVQIFLQLLQRLVQLFAEGHLIKLVQDRLMKPLADAVGLRRHRFGFRVVDIINRQIKLVIMVLDLAAILCATVS